jgi:hypothetical protein
MVDPIYEYAAQQVKDFDGKRMKSVIDSRWVDTRIPLACGWQPQRACHSLAEVLACSPYRSMHAATHVVPPAGGHYKRPV